MDIDVFLGGGKGFSGEVILFGAGFLGRTFAYKLLTTAGVKIDYYCDNNINIQGKKINGIEVISPQRVSEKKDNVFIFVGVGIEKAAEIEKQLFGYGVPEERIVRADYLLMQEIIEQVIISEDKKLIKQWDEFIDDEKYLKWRFKDYLGYDLNLNDPKTFNEKLQWLKIHDRRPEYSMLVDKYLVKEYVANTIGEEYVIPTLGVWEKFEDIDFGRLPNQFVLKCTHDSGSVVICRDKSTFDKEAARKKLTYCLKKNLYYAFREWPYKNVHPKLIAEEYVSADYKQHRHDLYDYKFLLFHGNVKMMYIATDRHGKMDTKFDFYDRDFCHLDIRNGHPNSRQILDKPIGYKNMIKLAEKLGENMPHVRVDFYELNRKIFFGEMTLYHMSGIAPFEPQSWDYQIGEWLHI